MKKILVGICGIGNGHINRQTNVIMELLKSNYEIVIATTENNRKVLEKRFPKIEKVYVDIPWITCNSNGIDFCDCLLKYKSKSVDYFGSFLCFAGRVEELFGGKPDFVISDYEPNVAQYAYASNKPLICMEQQSKFLYLNEEKIQNYSIEEEKYRINYFFPRYNYRIISSFFNIEIENKNVFVIPPIISKIERKEPVFNEGVVYFSPYCDDKQKFIKIINCIKNLEKINFNIYTNLNFNEYKEYTNLNFKEFGDEFKEDFSNASFVISSSGHQLISEAISCDMPMFLFQLDTYEQHYNSLMVEKNNLGKLVVEGTKEEFFEFYENIDNYVLNIKKFKYENWKETWNEKFSKIIDEITM